jgi:hypothetical protein
MKVNIVEAVLNAADEWVLAQEALVAAKQVSDETEAGGGSPRYRRFSAGHGGDPVALKTQVRLSGRTPTAFRRSRLGYR